MYVLYFHPFCNLMPWDKICISTSFYFVYLKKLLLLSIVSWQVLISRSISSVWGSCLHFCVFTLCEYKTTTVNIKFWCWLNKFVSTFEYFIWFCCTEYFVLVLLVSKFLLFVFRFVRRDEYYAGLFNLSIIVEFM